MPYDLAYLRQLVRDKLQGDDYFDATMIVAAINEGIDDLVMYSQVGQDGQDVAIAAGQREWPVDPNIFVVKGVLWNGRALREITYEDFRNMGGEQRTDTGEPGRYYLRNTATGPVIGLWPIPQAAGTRRTIGILKPTDLVLDTDVPMVPRVYTQAIVHYALYNLLENDAGRMAEADRHYLIYQRKRAEASTLLSASSKRRVRRIRPFR